MISGTPTLVNDLTPASLPNTAQLWQWSLALYPRIKTIALDWQDQFDVNVNLLLLLLYLQRQQLQLSTTEIQQLQQAVALQQQSFTAPLRQIRRQLPAHLSEQAAADFKQQLLQAELHSEQLEQQLLIQCLQGLNPCTTPVHISLSILYLQLLQIDPTPLQVQIVDLDQAVAAAAL